MGLRRQLLENTNERMDGRQAMLKRDRLLKDINEWMGRMGFDGQGLVLQERIKNLYWPDLAAEPEKVEDLPLTGTLCSVCGELQYEGSSGVTCPKGHGGAPASGELPKEET